MRERLVALVAAVACVAAAPVAARAADPLPDPARAEFTGCPAPPAVIDHCLVSTITGTLQVGRLSIDLRRPLVQNGGVPPAFPAPFEFNERGGLFSPSYPVAPAGAVVRATVEAAGVALSSLPFGDVLPIKLHLSGPLLGPRCRIGSDADPIVLDLTTGTTAPPLPNQPISGTVPGFGPDPADPAISLVTGGVLVDNAFAAPGLHGCGPGGRLDRALGRLAGLPSAAGTNTAVLAFDARLATQATVYPPAG